MTFNTVAIGCSLFLVGFLIKNHYPRFTGAPFQPFSKPPLPTSSVDSGLGMLKLRKERPTALGMLDITYPQEYGKAWTSELFKNLVGDISIPSITKEASDDVVDRVRPFVGETCYSLYACYRAIFGRIAIKLSEDVPAGKVNRWFEDSHTRTLLSTALTDRELETFDELQLGKMRWLTETFEKKILEQVNEITSGRTSTEEGIEQARRVLAAIQTVLDPRIVERSDEN